MVAFSVDTETQLGLTWERWKRRVAAVEEAGFAGLYLSDHFVMRDRPDCDSLDLIVALTYLACHTQRIHFGPMVAPLSFRDPVILARQAVALDDLSEGRMILSVGTGHIVREHTMFGYDLGDAAVRIARFAEGLAVITRLLRSEEPQSFAGQYFRLHEAMLATRPQRLGGPPILIGTNSPNKLLPLLAKYADIWNAYGVSAAAFRERSTKLDELLAIAGRPKTAVKRTIMLGLIFDYPGADLEKQISVVRRYIPSLADLPLAKVLEALATNDEILVGNAAELVEQLRPYINAGVEEIMLNCWDLDDDRWFQVFAEQVMPHFA